MTDKEMIEEMAKITNFTAFDYRQGTIQSKTIYTAMAEALYNADYRKMPEGAVVLTKGAYESISSKAKANVVNAVEIRKETAEKIFVEVLDLEDLKLIRDMGWETVYNSLYNEILELAKQFGVEIEE